MSRIRTNLITNRMANGAPTVSNGLVVSGVTTSTSFSGDGSALTGITQTTINNNADNRLITGSGTANTLEAESNITIDSSRLFIRAGSGSGLSSNADDLVIGANNDSTARGITIASTTNGNIRFMDGSDSSTGMIEYNHSSNFMRVYVEQGEALRIDSDRRLRVGNTTLSGTSASDDIMVGTTSGDHGISIFSGTSDAGFICFGDTDSTGVGSRAGTIRYQHSDNSFRFGTDGNNERVRITTNNQGGITIGNDDGYSIWNVTGNDQRCKIQIRQTTGHDRGVALIEDRGDANGMDLFISKSRGGNGVTAVNSGDTLGRILFSGADGTRQHNAAQIQAYTSGTIGTGRVPGNLSFDTAPDSASSVAVTMRMSSEGYVTTPRQPAASAYVSSGSPGASNNKIQNAVLGLNNTHFNNGGHFNTSNYRFTCPITGYYKVSYSTNLHTSNLTDGQNYQVNLRVNGSVRHFHYNTKQSSHTWLYMSFAETLYLQANDYIDLYLQGSGQLGVDASEKWNRATFELIG